MNQSQYTINNRPLSTFYPLTDELNFKPQFNYLFDLSYLGVVELEGAKSAEFLQGQISCDVLQVNEQQMRQGALCNLKGRVLALLDIIQWNGMKLVLPNDMKENIITSLNKTAAFSRVTLKSTDSYQVFGFLCQNPDDILLFNQAPPQDKWDVMATDNSVCYSFGHNLSIYIVRSNKAEQCSLPFKNQAQWRGALAWHKLWLESNNINIYPVTQGVFLPHRLGLQNSGHISFDKGCYKGQEIIARTHYRAKLKHKMQHFKIDTAEPLVAGSSIFNEEGTKEIGELVDFCPINDHEYLIAASVIFDHPDQCLFNGHHKPVQLHCA